MIDANFGINIAQEFQSGPTVFPGGIFPTQQFQNDLNYLWDLGIRHVRIPGANYSFQPAVTMQKTACLMAKAKGFYIHWAGVPIHGTGIGGNAPGDWYDWLPTVPGYVQWAQDNGVDIVSIGNEYDASFNIGSENFASMSRTSNVVTVTTNKPHGLVNGDSINTFKTPHNSGGAGLINGVTNNQQQSNIIVDSPTQFHFTSSGTDESTTVGEWAYTITTVRRKVKDLATSLKTAGFAIPLAYSFNEGVEIAPSTTAMQRWISLGRGNIDKIGMNVYDDGSTNFETSLLNTINSVNQGYNSFGSDHFEITEWNLRPTNSGFPTAMRDKIYFMMARLKFFQTKTNMIHYHFCFRERNNLLTVKNNYVSNTKDLTYNDWWYAMIGKRAPSVTVGNSFSNATTKALVTQRTIPSAVASHTLQFNYGNDLQSGTQAYNTSVVANDLSYLYSHGVRKLRMGTGNLSFTSGVNAVKQGVLDAKAHGFYVVLVPAGVTGGLNDSNWSSSYTPLVQSLADWAQANGVDEFQVGNEIEGEYNWSGAGALTDIVNKIKALATDIKANHFSRAVSYAMAQDRLESTWLSTGKGDLDFLSYNKYGATVNNLNLAIDETEWENDILNFVNVFGSAFYLSEWNLPWTWPFPPTELQQAAALTTRMNFLQAHNITNFFFTYKWPTNGDFYALLKTDGTYRAWWSALFTQVTKQNINQTRQAVENRPIT